MIWESHYNMCWRVCRVVSLNMMEMVFSTLMLILLCTVDRAFVHMDYADYNIPTHMFQDS